MEITGMTFVTLSILLMMSIWGLIKLFKALGKHDNIKYTTLNDPLKNKNKPWYHRQGRPGDS